ncbi:patatin-like phospholipase family protein [Candidatus Venteria ishoeyi]|uniref:NTE family protein RssA n=1 Tax=Candidatus Venteria ishoeyi TaxID=1899563 RepID=A0A1H6F4L7_9GAMM|nr:patatin-like phospholipase family protein [Candidatus Venteria ishoeyi]MDM8547223.1 patatin-like phospholipase family protein [Candidatus Venteria ishoeyi]SEH05070.1 NTE family protein RssA [Candidatus Venteria ishoeyi]
MKKTVSLILGSGGARGLTHIGIIRELEQRGYDIRAIVGCSMGSLVGGLYAAGQLDAYTEWVSELTEWDVLRFLDISLTIRSGMMKGDLIMDKLRELVGEQQIEDLAIPFTAVATDIIARREVWLGHGDLFEAIRASIAIPGIFTPQVVGGKMLVDGGLLNPLPIAPATDDWTDLTIAVSLSGRAVSEPLGPNPVPHKEHSIAAYRARIDNFLGVVQKNLGLEASDEPEPQHLSLSSVLMSMFDTMQSAIARYRLAAYPPDVLIEIPENVCASHEFYKADQLIAAGHYWAQQALAQSPSPASRSPADSSGQGTGIRT